MVSVTTDSRCLKFIGLSSDDKPVNDSVGNGSLFLEMDTGSVFCFDGEAGEWTEIAGAVISFTL